jgi:two-component system, NarL family, nitrate/nitrite response regulator NarL
MPIQTLLIGARPMFRAGVARFLTESGFDVIAAADDVEAVIRAAPKEPALAIIDATRCPMKAVREINLLHAGFSEVRIVLLAEPGQLDYAHIVAAFHAGMSAYLINPTPEVFVKSLELVMLGQSILPRELVLEAPRRAAESTVSTLSARETQVLRHLAQGRTNKEIARTLVSADATIKVHVKAIMRKLRVKNRTQAANWAMQNLPTANGVTAASQALTSEISVV